MLDATQRKKKKYVMAIYRGEGECSTAHNESKMPKVHRIGRDKRVKRNFFLGFSRADGTSNPFAKGVGLPEFPLSINWERIKSKEKREGRGLVSTTKLYMTTPQSSQVQVPPSVPVRANHVGIIYFQKMEGRLVLLPPRLVCPDGSDTLAHVKTPNPNTRLDSTLKDTH